MLFDQPISPFAYRLTFQSSAARPTTNAASTPDNNILLPEDRRAAAAAGYGNSPRGIRASISAIRSFVKSMNALFSTYEASVPP